MVDLALHLTIAATAASFIVSMIMMLLWARMEGLKESFESHRTEYNKEMRDFRREFNSEMKDFHGRLCKIEEDRNRILLREK